MLRLLAAALRQHCAMRRRLSRAACMLGIGFLRNCVNPCFCLTKPARLAPPLRGALRRAAALPAREFDSRVSACLARGEAAARVPGRRPADSDAPPLAPLNSREFNSRVPVCRRTRWGGPGPGPRWGGAVCGCCAAAAAYHDAREPPRRRSARPPRSSPGGRCASRGLSSSAWPRRAHPDRRFETQRAGPSQLSKK
jgi:hypothetical protein